MSKAPVISDLADEIIRLRQQKDFAYSERDKLVALLSKLFPASLERHQPEDDPDWDENWLWVVYINLPTGQCGWHIHDSELPLFDHLPRMAGRIWDGHTTEEKYQRIAAIPSLEEIIVDLIIDENLLVDHAAECEDCANEYYHRCEVGRKLIGMIVDAKRRYRKYYGHFVVDLFKHT